MCKQQENLIEYKTKENVFCKQKKGSNMSGNEVFICLPLPVTLCLCHLHWDKTLSVGVHVISR